MQPRTLGFELAALALAGACSNSPPAADPTEVDEPETVSPTTAPTAMAVQSELGSLEKAAVQETFRAAAEAIDQCVAAGRRRQPLIGGAIEVVVRVNGDGTTRWAYLLQSDLGDHVTEACILAVLGEQSWPRPSGGEEGETTQQLDMGDPEERPPIPWSAEDLGPRFRTVSRSLSQCRRNAHTGPVDVTFYVDPDGRALGAGVAVADEKGLEAVDCAVRAIRGARFASPGSYPAKVTVQVD